MPRSITIGLVGDFDAAVPAHQAIPLALPAASDAAGASLLLEWIGTDSIRDRQRLAPFDGLWCMPGSPYRSMEGAPFFVATLFQPERAALRGEPVPLVGAFLAEAAAR